MSDDRRRAALEHIDAALLRMQCAAEELEGDPEVIPLRLAIAGEGLSRQREDLARLVRPVRILAEG